MILRIAINRKSKKDEDLKDNLHSFGVVTHLCVSSNLSINLRSDNKSKLHRTLDEAHFDGTDMDSLSYILSQHPRTAHRSEFSDHLNTRNQHRNGTQNQESNETQLTF